MVMSLTFKQPKKQSGINNIYPALASVTELPFPNEYFDVVAFNGVLEWLGAIDKNAKPLKFQIQALREAKRVLKTNGLIYIGVENRFSLRYFLGSPDDHSFMRFTSLMPRSLANWYCRLSKGEIYYQHTYSLNAYRKLFEKLGFSNIEYYYPWPSYKALDKIVPLEKDRILEHCSYIVANSRIFSRRWIYTCLLYILTRIDKKGFFCHSYCFVLKK